MHELRCVALVVAILLGACTVSTNGGGLGGAGGMPSCATGAGGASASDGGPKDGGEECFSCPGGG